MQVAALRVLAGLLEASAEGLDAFRVRDGFNVLYHALAQGDDALQQVRDDNLAHTLLRGGDSVTREVSPLCVGTGRWATRMLTCAHQGYC